MRIFRALGIRKHLLGERNLDVANTLYLLVTLWIHQGRKSDAIPLLEECLAVRAEVLGDGHEQTVWRASERSRRALHGWCAMA